MLTVHGTGFAPSHQVIECVFGGVLDARTAAYFVDSTTVRCAVPWELPSAGSADVSVTADTAHHNEFVHRVAFQVHAVPQVTAINPAAVIVAGGTPATVTASSPMPELWFAPHSTAYSCTPHGEPLLQL